MFKHLCWSLLGIADLDPLDSVDSPSVTLARFLFGAFLIMGVILLVNMMIALLSNTYQRVEVPILLCFSIERKKYTDPVNNFFTMGVIVPCLNAQRSWPGNSVSL